MHPIRARIIPTPGVLLWRENRRDQAGESYVVAAGDVLIVPEAAEHSIATLRARSVRQSDVRGRTVKNMIGSG